MKLSNGLFVSLEGPEAAGKSTQITMLKNSLDFAGIDTVFTREPGGTKLAETLRNIVKHHADENEKMDDITELLLFTAARQQHVVNHIKPNVENNKLVISDRYWDSTAAYQGYGRGLDLTLINFLNQVVVNYRPHVTFYIKISYEVMLKRMRERGIVETDRLENNDETFHRNVMYGYDELAIKEPSRFVIIDGERSERDIHYDIASHILRMIK